MEPSAPGEHALTYASYLALEDLLGAQHPRSDEHDELLFIVVHQVYELWFKQLLHELAHAQQLLTAGATPPALHTLRRVLTILKVAVAQIDVLETMTPRQFTGFRDRLAAASGFQSAQFRELEAVLGRRDRDGARGRPRRQRATRPGGCGDDPALAVRRLPRLPGRARVSPSRPSPSGATSRSHQPRHRVSTTVLLAVYADDGGPAQVCERLVDLDEGLQEWRYRHVKMVERTIGDTSGTGGSSGAAYLRSTLFTPLFPDLWAVRGQL